MVHGFLLLELSIVLSSVSHPSPVPSTCLVLYYPVASASSSSTSLRVAPPHPPLTSVFNSNPSPCPCIMMSSQPTASKATSACSSALSSVSSSIKPSAEKLQDDLLKVFLSHLDRTCMKLLDLSSSSCSSSSRSAVGDERRRCSPTEGQKHDDSHPCSPVEASSCMPLGTSNTAPTPSSGFPSGLGGEFREEDCLLFTVLQEVEKKQNRCQPASGDGEMISQDTENNEENFRKEKKASNIVCTDLNKIAPTVSQTSRSILNNSFSTCASPSDDNFFCCGDVFRKLRPFFEDSLHIPPPASPSSFLDPRETGEDKTGAALPSKGSSDCFAHENNLPALSNNRGDIVVETTGGETLTKNRKGKAVLFPPLPSSLLGRITKLLERPPSGLIGVGRFRESLSRMSSSSSSPPSSSSPSLSSPLLSSPSSSCTWEGGDPQVLVVRPLVLVDESNSTVTKRENRKRKRRKGHNPPSAASNCADAAKTEGSTSLASDAPSSSFPQAVIQKECPTGEGQRKDRENERKQGNNQLARGADDPESGKSFRADSKSSVHQERGPKRERETEEEGGEEEGLPESSAVLTPFPTIFWLCDELYRKEISTLEVQGFMKKIEKRLREDRTLQTNLIYDNLRYIALRWLLLPKEVLRHYYSVSSPSCRKEKSSREKASSGEGTKAIPPEDRAENQTAKEEKGATPTSQGIEEEHHGPPEPPCSCRLCRFLAVFRQRGIGGIQYFSSSIRCLHMHYAYHLVLPPSSIGVLVERELSKRDIR
ncbi:rhoptry protein [Cystoisospora suis]|uniref:Rhoptry protein n=1 Tax=Cystoisospora suis TaxID=483139 RepID=A0A2C6L2K9_9APIC|nr:rhoptry protein [Cystoisospora suis]